MAKPVRFVCYVDYVCPYAYRGALWLDEVQRLRPGEVEVDYRHFSLEQINNTVDDWKVWEQEHGYESSNPARNRARALLAFWAAEAARNQGEEAYAGFRRAILDARHVDKLDFTDQAGVRAAAEKAGLDMQRFDADMQDRGLLDRLRKDHETSTGEHGVFGVPTFVFPNGESAFVKITTVPEGQAALDLFDEVVKATVERPYLIEIKRPTKPS